MAPELGGSQASPENSLSQAEITSRLVENASQPPSQKDYDALIRDVLILDKRYGLSPEIGGAVSQLGRDPNIWRAVNAGAKRSYEIQVTTPDPDEYKAAENDTSAYTRFVTLSKMYERPNYDDLVAAGNFTQQQADTLVVAWDAMNGSLNTRAGISFDHIKETEQIKNTQAGSTASPTLVAAQTTESQPAAETADRSRMTYEQAAADSLNLTTEQLNDLPKPVLLELIFNGNLSKRQMLMLPINNRAREDIVAISRRKNSEERVEYLRNMAEQNPDALDAMTIESYRQTYVMAQEIADQISKGIIELTHPDDSRVLLFQEDEGLSPDNLRDWLNDRYNNAAILIEPRFHERWLPKIGNSMHRSRVSALNRKIGDAFRRLNIGDFIYSYHPRIETPEPITSDPVKESLGILEDHFKLRDWNVVFTSTEDLISLNAVDQAALVLQEIQEYLARNPDQRENLSQTVRNMFNPQFYKGDKTEARKMLQLRVKTAERLGVDLSNEDIAKSYNEVLASLTEEPPANFAAFGGIDTHPNPKASGLIGLDYDALLARRSEWTPKILEAVASENPDAFSSLIINGDLTINELSELTPLISDRATKLHTDIRELVLDDESFRNTDLSGEQLQSYQENLIRERLKLLEDSGERITPDLIKEAMASGISTAYYVASKTFYEEINRSVPISDIEEQLQRLIADNFTKNESARNISYDLHAVQLLKAVLESDYSSATIGGNSNAYTTLSGEKAPGEKLMPSAVASEDERMPFRVESVSFDELADRAHELTSEDLQKIFDMSPANLFGLIAFRGLTLKQVSDNELKIDDTTLKIRDTIGEEFDKSLENEPGLQDPIRILDETITQLKSEEITLSKITLQKAMVEWANSQLRFILEEYTGDLDLAAIPVESGLNLLVKQVMEKDGGPNEDQLYALNVINFAARTMEVIKDYE